MGLPILLLRMKSYVIAVISIVLVAIVISGDCRHKDDCGLTSCNSNGTMICDKDKCTCAMKCSDKVDCDSITPGCKHHEEEYHCIDLVCTCFETHHGPGH